MIRNGLLYILVLAISGTLAWALWNQWHAPAEPPPLEGIDDPLWYRTADFATRRAALEKRLDLMTSTRIAAADVGPIKDDVALLCRDPRLVDVVVQRFRERKDINTAQLSAFMEIFARVKNPKFAKLLSEGIHHREFEPRINAFDAALTQGDPAILADLRTVMGSQGGYSLRRVIEALGAIGGDEALDLVTRAIASGDHDAVLQGIATCVVYRLNRAIPILEPLLKDGRRDVALTAAWGLVSLGYSGGADVIRRLALDRGVDQGTRAQAVIYLLETSGKAATETLRRLRADPDPNVAFEARLGLIKLGDEDELLALDRALRSEDPGEREQGATFCAASGRDEDVERFRRVMGSVGRAEITAFLNALPRGRAPAALSILKDLSRPGGPYEQLAISRFHEYGDDGVEAIETLLASHPEGERLGWLISALGSIGTPRARDTLLKMPPPRSRRLWLYLRNNVRVIDLALLKKGVFE